MDWLEITLALIFALIAYALIYWRGHRKGFTKGYHQAKLEGDWEDIFRD